MALRQLHYTALTGLLLLAICWIYLNRSTELAMPAQPVHFTPATPGQTLTATATIKTATTKTHNPRWVTRKEDSSLAGSAVDRATVTSHNGLIVLNGGVLIYFDYFLSLEGEMPMSRIKELIRQDMQANFTPGIADQLYDVFERYVAYLAAVAKRLDELTYETVKAEGITARSLASEIQRQFFSEDEINALFNGYDNMLSFTSQATTFQKKFEAYLHTDEKSSAAMATELFGAEAAGRLQQLQQRRLRWQERLRQYRTEKQWIISSNNMTRDDKIAAANHLLERSFNHHEQIRVKTLDQSMPGMP